MENKDQNNTLSYGLDAGQAITGGTVREAPIEPDALSLEPENPGLVNSQAQPKGQANLFLRFARRADVLLFALLLITGVALFFVTKHQQAQQSANSTSSVASQYGSIKIPLSDLTAGKQLTLAGAANVTINGPMQLNDALILAPTLQPTGAKPGQLYYDQTNNQLAYYNGSNFVFLTAQNPVTGLQSLGGATGQLGVGTGLTITNNQLLNSGVLSVQGLAGAVTLAAGPGIVINGTTFSNSGVLSVAPGDSHIIVASDGAGNIKLSVTGAGAGTVTSSGGTNGVVPLFTGSQNIQNSIISQAGMTVTISGDLSVVTGGLSLTNALTVSNGGTGTTSLAGNGVLVGNGTAAVSSVATGSAGLCLLSTVGAPAWGACPTSGGVVSLNGLSGALSLANASAAGSTVTIDNASTIAKGIASFNATNFTVTGGAVNTVQNLNTGATPTFAGLNTNIITPSGALTVGATGQAYTLQGTAASVLTATSGVNTTTLGFATPTANVTYHLQTATAGVYDICTTAGNCDTPNEITSPGGTVNTLAKFTGAQVVGNSIITDNGTTVGVGGALSVSSTSLFTGQITTNGGITSTGALTITSGGAGALTLGSSTQQLILQGNSSTQMVVTGGVNTTTVTFASPTSNVTYRFATATAGTYDICSTAGNCAGSGGGVTTPGGTTNAIPKFTGAQTLGNSSISDNGTNVTTSESVVIQGGTVTLGVAATKTGAIDLLHSASSFIGTIVQGSMTASRTYTLPDVSGTICTSAGNCSGAGSANTLQAAYDAGNTIATSSGRDIAFTLAHTTVDANFTVTIGTGSTGTVSIVRANGAGTADPAQLLLLANQDIARSVASGLKIQSAAGGITTAIDLTDANIGTAVSVGAHNISGTTGGLSFTNFAIAGASGNITTNGTVNGQTISATASFTGSLSVVGATTVGGSLAANGGNITSTGTLTVTPGGTLTLGATGQQLILQGNASTQLTATGGGFTTTVGFTGVPTAAVTYNFDRTPATGTYTICTSIGNCAGAGSGVTTAGGTVGTLPVFTASQAIGNSLVSQSGGTVTVNGNLNLITGNTFQVNGTQISSANLSNDANLAKLSASQTFTGNTVAFQNALNSTNAFNVQNSAGTRIFTVDSAGAQVVLGTALASNGTLMFNNVSNSNVVYIVPGTPTANRTLTLPNASGIICTDSGNCAGAGATLQTAYNFSVGGTTPKIKLNGTLLGLDIQDADTTIAANLFNVRASNAVGLGSVLFGVGSTGQATFQNSANSTTSWRILTQGGTAVMTGDTVNGQVIMGQGGTLNGAIVFNNSSNANTITLTTAAATAIQTITLPNATGTICLTSGNCAGAGSSNTLQAAYDAGNTITTSNSRDITFTMADTAIDSNFVVNLQCVTSCGSNGRFAVQNSGVDVLSVAPTTGTVKVNSNLQVSQNGTAAGTVTNGAASASVTGTGTTFMSTFQPGDTFTVTATGNTCTISSIASDTSLTCNATLAGAATGSAYTFTPQTRLAVNNNGNTVASGVVTLNSPSAPDSYSMSVDPASGKLRLEANSFGNAGKPSSSVTAFTGTMYASKYNSGSGGTTSNVRLYTPSVATAPNNHVKVAIYSDSAGNPGTLVSSASAPSTVATAGWNTVPLGGQVTLAPNTNYWLTFTTESSSTTSAWVTGSANQSSNAAMTFSGTFPASFGATPSGTNAYTIYVPYTTIATAYQATAGLMLDGNSDVIVQPASDGDALQVVNAAGTTTSLSVSTLNNWVSVNKLNINSGSSNGMLTVVSGATGTTAASFSGYANTTAPLFILNQGPGATTAADILQIKDGGGNLVSRINYNGNQLYLGRAATGGSVYAGIITLADGTTSNATATIQTTGTLTSSSTFQLNVAGAGGTYQFCTTFTVCTGYAPASGSANYIQNTTTVQSANMYVRAATSGTVAAVLQANAAGAGDILDLNNGAGAAVATVSSTGSVLHKTSTNSTTAFQLQNSAGTAVFTADTTNTAINVNAAAGNGTLNTIGGITAQALAAPASATITQGGTAGATTYTYNIYACDDAACNFISPALTKTTTTGNATLSATNYNILSWAAVAGARGYAIYLTAGPSSPMYLTITASTTYNDTGFGFFSSAPTAVSSGSVSAAGGGSFGGNLSVTGSTTTGSLTVQGGSTNVLGGTYTINGVGNIALANDPSSLAIQGGIAVTGLATPSAPSVTPHGTTGATSYNYYIAACSTYCGAYLGVWVGQSTPASTAGPISNGNATLTTSNYNTVSWSAVNGAVGYVIYRFTGGVYSLVAVAGQNATSYNDTGTIIMSGVTLPTVDQTGNIQAANGQFTNVDAGSAAALNIGNTTATSIVLGKQSGAVNIGTTINGTTLVKPNSDVTNAFQVQKAGSTTAVFDVDTSNGRIGVGTATPGRTVDVAINNTTVNAPALRILQSGTGDSSMEFANSTASFFMGVDTSSTNAFALSSTASMNGSTNVGYTTAHPASLDHGNNNSISSTKVTATVTGTVNSISVYIGSVDPTNQHMQVALYTDAGGVNALGTVLATSTSQVLSPNAWNTFPLNASVVNGTSYWLAFNVDGAATYYGYSTTGTSKFSAFGGVTYGTWSNNPAIGSTNAAWAYDIYMSVTGAAGTDTFSNNVLTITQNGNATFKNASDSANAFRVVNAAGTTQLAVDTSGSNIYMGDPGGTTNTTVRLTTNNSATTSAFSILQNGTGDASMTFGDTLSDAFYMGYDNSNTAFSIGSSGTTGAITTSGTTAFNAYDSTVANQIRGTKVTAGATGTVSTISVFVGYVDATNPHMQVALYSDSAGMATLLTKSATQTLMANGWNSFSVPAASVTSGTAYWLALNVDGANTNIGYSTTGNLETCTVAGCAYGLWPNNPTSSTTSASHAMMIKMAITATGSTDNFANPSFSIQQSGAATFQAAIDSTNAFRVVNPAGVQQLSVDTHTSTVIVGDTSGTNSTNLQVQGNVGIGTGSTAPTRPLQVAVSNTQTATPMALLQQGGTGNSSLEFQNTNAGTSMYIGQDNGNSGAFSIGSSTAAPGTPGITFVQSITGHYNQASPVITAQATSNFSTAVTAGNLLVVAVSFDTTNTTTFSCTDTLGNTFTNATFRNNTTNAQGLGVCYAANVVGGTDAVTAHFGGTGSMYISVIATEYHNATTTPLDVSTNNFATATVSANGGTTGAATTTAAGDLVFAAFDDTAGEHISGAGTGLVQRGTTTGVTGIQTLVEDKTQPTAGSTSATAGFSVADLYVGVLVTFKRVAAGAVTNTFNNSLMTVSQSGATKFQNYTDSTTAFQVQNSAGTALLNVDTTNGYVGIGKQTTTPWTALNVQDSQASNYVADIYNYNTGANAKGLLIQLGVADASRASTNYFVAFADSTTVAGKIQGGASAVVYATSGADYAEYFGAPSNDLPVAGELVAMDTANGRSVIRATGGTKQVLPGVVSTNPGFVGNGPLCKVHDDDCDKNYMKYNVLVSMTGQVPTKVNTTNGPINIGDPITISSVPGQGAKATSAGYIVGYAQESLTSGSGTIQVLIQPQYYTPAQSDILQGASLSVTGDASVGGTLNAGNLNVGGLATLTTLTVTGNATFKGDVTVAGKLEVQSIKVNGHIITAGIAPTVQVLPAIGTGAAVVVSGNDTAGTITVTTGQGTLTAGDLAKLVFASAFGGEPRVQVTPVGASSAALQPYVSQSPTDFTLGVVGAPVAGQTYIFNYSVMQ